MKFQELSILNKVMAKQCYVIFTLLINIGLNIERLETYLGHRCQSSVNVYYTTPLKTVYIVENPSVSGLCITSKQ